MITKPQVVPLLIEASPSFQAKVDEHMAYYEEVLHYTLLGDFARHLLQLQRENRTAEFPIIAQLIERLHTEGDACVSEAATIGLLEGVQSVWANDGADPELFATHLLPESRRWWDELNAFWRGERRYVGEGLQREITAEEVQVIQQEIHAYNERLKLNKESAK